ncbi:MAG: SU10 major capsid protein, partial [Planctomycetota bacterium]
EIIAPAALEGDEAPAVRFQNRNRKLNYTQIFTETVEVSKTKLALNNIGVVNELDHQTMARLRELTRYLESAVINGRAASATGMGSSTVRRTMNGLVAHLNSHVYQADTTADFSGLGVDLDEVNLNLLFRKVWENSDAPIDFILCNGFQKRRINAFNASSMRTARTEDVAGNRVDVYESDFGVAKVVLSRWVPPDVVLVGASSHLDVLQLQSRSFSREPLGRVGDAVKYQVTGEYTLELRNEGAFGMLHGLSVS